MDDERIIKKMKELEDRIHYKFKDILWLSKAMQSTKIDVQGSGKNHKEYSNDALATVGDAILKAVIADKLFSDTPEITKGKLTKEKESLENNKTLHDIDLKEGIIDYAFNEKYFYKDPEMTKHDKVSSKAHDAYIEAIVAAVYYDSNFETAKQWIYKYLYPLLEKYKVK